VLTCRAYHLARDAAAARLPPPDSSAHRDESMSRSTAPSRREDTGDAGGPSTTILENGSALNPIERDSPRARRGPHVEGASAPNQEPRRGGRGTIDGPGARGSTAGDVVGSADQRPSSARARRRAWRETGRPPLVANTVVALNRPQPKSRVACGSPRRECRRFRCAGGPEHSVHSEDWCRDHGACRVA